MSKPLSPIECMIDEACGYTPPRRDTLPWEQGYIRPQPMPDDCLAYIIYFDDPKHLIHYEQLPGLTPCGLAFSDLFGEIAVGRIGLKEGAPACKECFPDV